MSSFPEPYNIFLSMKGIMCTLSWLHCTGSRLFERCLFIAYRTTFCKHCMRGNDIFYCHTVSQFWEPSRESSVDPFSHESYSNDTGWLDFECNRTARRRERSAGTVEQALSITFSREMLKIWHYTEWWFNIV